MKHLVRTFLVAAVALIGVAQAQVTLTYWQYEFNTRVEAMNQLIEQFNAENPDKGFMPSAGVIEQLFLPGGPGVRMDSHIVPGYRVPPNYDSMIGKLIVHAEDRKQCINRMKRALRELTIGPINTTIPLHLRLMENADFAAGGVDIHYLERLLK